MVFKNVGKLQIRITKAEEEAGLYATPALSVGSRFKPLNLSPKNAKEPSPAGSSKLERYRLNVPFVVEQYVVVGILSYQWNILDHNLNRGWTKIDIPVYHFVKKRNYNKYIAQQLADNHRIDYVIARRQKVFDKAISLGLIQVI